MATSVESKARTSRSPLISSARLSKRPSQVITASDGERWGCDSRRDSFVVWKAPIKNLYGAFGIRFVAVGVRTSESCADLLDVVPGWRLALEIPSSKLHAHDSFPLCFRLILNTCRALHTFRAYTACRSPRGRRLQPSVGFEGIAAHQ